ncbi:uncharacterized protein ATNIH1004_006652 [Aspergillus tanneri]|uniref:Uncharacterized protein n=1 Tax=Aspergillus tanneri TaxID=1220188 RepID=A0A5M9MJU2_9EURO|nr:uncharacterized protein ATNIH1004_006652 [Aspergillus tanneri]KAA8645233.1 hypothetical protein ATNIH1004_006652 [Aspergillus tanneri]
MAGISVIKLLVDYEVFDAIPESEDISIVELSNKQDVDAGLLELFNLVTGMSSPLRHPVAARYDVLETVTYKSDMINRAMATREQLPTTEMYDFSWVGAAAQKRKLGSRSNIVNGGGRRQALRAILQGNLYIPAALFVLMDRVPAIRDAKHDDDSTLCHIQQVSAAASTPFHTDGTPSTRKPCDISCCQISNNGLSTKPGSRHCESESTNYVWPQIPMQDAADYMIPTPTYADANGEMLELAKD